MARWLMTGWGGNWRKPASVVALLAAALCVCVLVWASGEVPPGTESDRNGVDVADSSHRSPIRPHGDSGAPDALANVGHLAASPDGDDAVGRAAASSVEWVAVESDVAAREYEINWQESTRLADLAAAWQAPNRAHGFRTYFTETGIRVIPRSGETPEWEWGLTLSAWGRPGSMTEAEPAGLRVDGTRIEYDRGSIVEWYINDTRGLEQGFTLEVPPGDAGESEEVGSLEGARVSRESAGDDDGARVHIDLALAGTLVPAIAEGGGAIDFATPHGLNALHYGGLVVRDALGRELPAWMEEITGPGMARGIRIVFEDEAAVYPVTVDPLVTSPAWTAESNQANAGFGTSVATAGDVNGDGYADVIVGAPEYDNGQTNEGRAFLYLGSPSGLATSPAWTAESDQASAHFGYSVATAGDVNGDDYADVIIGARFYESEGRAFVYLGSPSGLATSPAWTAESNQTNALFGVSVATAGDVNGDDYADVIVGASSYDNGQMDEGRAFVYLGSPSGLATSPAWTAESDQESSRFGDPVATAGDVNSDGYADVIVGASVYGNGQSSEGRAFVYLGSPTGLATSPAWTAESNQVGGFFGISVATAGDVNGDDHADVIVGAHWYDNGQTNEGRAFVYLGSPSGLAASPAWTAESNQADATFGDSVATAGDVNGDGYADVIVGAPEYTNGQNDEGRAFVYLGSPAGLATSPAWFAESNQPFSAFGSSAGTAGDVNGDGYADVIVGAPLYDNGQTNEGRAFVYHGLCTGTDVDGDNFCVPTDCNDSNPNCTFDCTDADADGFCVTHDCDDGNAACNTDCTDTDGDGLTPCDGDCDDENAACTTDCTDADADDFCVTHDCDDANSHCTTDCTDADGDGWCVAHDCSDLIAACTSSCADGDGDGLFACAECDDTNPNCTTDCTDTDADGFCVTHDCDEANPNCTTDCTDADADGFCVTHDCDEANPACHTDCNATGGGGLPGCPNWTAETENDHPAAHFGASVATAGDVNGDGYADVIIGAPQYDNGQDENDEGRVFVFLGSPAGVLGVYAAWTAESDLGGAAFGASVAWAGDVNGDGYADVIVGAPGRARAFVYLGSSSGLATSPAWTVLGQGSGAFGLSVSTAGDVNGDGYADVIVGAPRDDNGQTNEGRAFVYLGSASGLATSPAWTAESNQAESEFGTSVATAGDVNGDSYADVIVGAPFDQTDGGRAFVYLGSPAGLATSPAWTAESNQAQSEFGTSVATTGDVNGDGYADVIVGATRYDNGQFDEGRAFVYLGSSSGLATGPAWTAESNQASALFGNSVATAGDVNADGHADVIVGAPFHDNGESGEGRAFVYLGSPSGLATSPTWTAESDQAGARFGSSVATAGDVNGDGYADVILGAQWYDNGGPDEGRAFVYHGSCTDTDADGFCGPADCDDFEPDCAADCTDVDEDGLAVCAGDCDDLNPNCTTDCTDADADGFCVTHDCNDANPICHAGCTDTDGDGSTSCDGDCLEGNAACTTDCTDADADGFCVTHDCADANFHCTTDCTDADGDGWCVTHDCSDVFEACTSSCVDGDGDGVPLCAPDCDDANAYCMTDCTDDDADGYCGTQDCDDANPICHSGCTDTGLAGCATWAAESDRAESNFGYSVAAAGDVNGDGYADVIVGALGSEFLPGEAFVYLGSPSGLAPNPAWTAESGLGDDYFGFSVATAGDVNGDGYADVIVGSPTYAAGQAFEGRAFVYLGSPTGLATSPAWIAESNQASAWFGYSVATAGDVNDDGYADVIVGAYSYSNGEDDEGRVFVYLGSPSGLATSPAWTAESNQEVALFGSSVATAGDVNGDGYADVIVGARWYDNGLTDEGRAFVYLGSPAGLATSPAWTAESNQEWAQFGSVATAGDLNGDGYADVIVGAPGYANPESTEGRAFVYLGSPLGLAPNPAWTAESNQTEAGLGYSVATAGDVNGDGYADVIVGAPWYDNGQIYEGRAFVYLGSPFGLAPNPAWTAESDQMDAYFGVSVATAGDVDGDGYADVIVGASSYDNGQTDEGRAFVFLGSCTGTDADADGLCVPADCDDANPSCTTDCTDADTDGFCVTVDCNDADPAVNPGGAEVCNGIDDDCDELIDEIGVLGSTLGSKTGSIASFDWEAVEGASGYDAIKGRLGDLLSTSGDFSSATTECIGNDLLSGPVDDEELPAAGDALWYLIRALNCAGTGSYDSGGPGQAAPRDESIADSTEACP